MGRGGLAGGGGGATFPLAILDFWMGVSDSMRTLKKARECFKPWVDLAPPQM